MNHLVRKKYVENPIFVPILIYGGIAVGAWAFWEYLLVGKTVKGIKEEFAELSVRGKRALPWACGAAGLHVASGFIKDEKVKKGSFYGALGSAGVGLIQAMRKVTKEDEDVEIKKLQKDLETIRKRTELKEAVAKASAIEEAEAKERIAKQTKALESETQKAKKRLSLNVWVDRGIWRPTIIPIWPFKAKDTLVFHVKLTNLAPDGHIFRFYHVEILAKKKGEPYKEMLGISFDTIENWKTKTKEFELSFEDRGTTYIVKAELFKRVFSKDKPDDLIPIKKFEFEFVLTPEFFRG